MNKKEENKKKLSDSEEESIAKDSGSNGSSNDEIKEEKVFNWEEIIGDLENKLKNLQDKNLRLRAELENQDRQHKEELKNTVKYGNEKILKEILFFPDNYERASQSAEEIRNNLPQKEDNLKKSLEGLLSGLQIIIKCFEKILKDQGVEEIEVTPFKSTFDANLHSSIDTKESNDYPDGTILDVSRKGYKIHQRILRPTTVVISQSTKKN